MKELVLRTDILNFCYGDYGYWGCLWMWWDVFFGWLGDFVAGDDEFGYDLEEGEPRTVGTPSRDIMRG